MKKFFLLSVIILFVGCDPIKQSIEEEIVSNEATKTFEALWSKLDSNYVYFRENGYDWDAYKKKYMKLLSEAKSDTAYMEIAEMFIAEMQDVNMMLLVPGRTFGYHLPERKIYNDGPWTGNLTFYVENGIYYWKDSVASDHYISFQNMYRAEDTSQSKPYLYIVPHYYGGIQKDNSSYIGLAFSSFNVTDLQGVILDLRANDIKLPYNMMLELLRYLLPEGDNVIYYESRRNVAENRYQLSSPEPYILNCNGTYSDKPLVVLFNPTTVNEANIMCYVLQERQGTVTISNSYTGGGGSIRERFIANATIGLRAYYPNVHLSNDKYESFNKPLKPMLRIEGDYAHGTTRIDNRIVSALHCIDSINALK